MSAIFICSVVQSSPQFTGQPCVAYLVNVGAALCCIAYFVGHMRPFGIGVFADLPITCFRSGRFGNNRMRLCTAFCVASFASLWVVNGIG